MGAFLIKQFFHSRLYAPRWLSIISYPTSASGIIVNYNIVTRAAQSNSVYVTVLKIPIVHADSVSKSLRQKFYFSPERPLLARGKILYFATIMDTNRDSAHQSQNEVRNFATFSVGLEFLIRQKEREKQRKRSLGISAVTIRFTVRG